MQWLKNTPFHIICLLLSVALLGIWHGRSGHSEFAGDLLTAVQNLHGERDQLKVSRITRFGWDRMFVFPPYTPAAEISKVLGKPVPASITKFGIDERDDINLLVFLNGQSVVEVSPVPRNAVDIVVGLVGMSLDANNAVFAKASAGNILALAALKE